MKYIDKVENVKFFMVKSYVVSRWHVKLYIFPSKVLEESWLCMQMQLWNF